MRVLVATDKFKGCLTAVDVARNLAEGMRAVRTDLVVDLLPVADGGDGTVAAAVAAGFTEITVRVEGPTGAPVDAPYAVRGRRAVVELAASCGLDLLPGGRLEPLTSSTHGLGQVIAHAIDGGARQIVLGLGGSASTDGGAGMLAALGARILDDAGRPVGRGGGGLAAAATLDLAPLRTRMAGVDVMVASDVDNPLLGPDGATEVFGPQKGAGPAERAILEAALGRWADLVAVAVGTDLRERPGAGAAGGTGFAAIAGLGAQLRPGIELVLDLLGFDAAVAGADLVVTGEGSLDEQSLNGKAPVGVAQAAGRAQVRVLAVAGRSVLDDERLHAAGIETAYQLLDLEPDTARSMATAPQLLRRVGRRIAEEWL